MTLEFPEPAKFVIASRYLIYIAAGVFNASEASLINFADSTSALAEIILASAVLFAVAADAKLTCKSYENKISYINTLTI